MLIPKNLKGKHVTDDWNGVNAENHAKHSTLKSFQNIFRGFHKYFAKKDEKHHT